MFKVYLKTAKKSILIGFIATFCLVNNPVSARTPFDPEYPTQEVLWQQIGAENAWKYTTGSRDVTVAVIDTGIDTWHDDLRDNIWTNPYEIPGNGIDDDHNGYIDDINGWNFVENNNDVRTSVIGTSNDPEAVRHGTVIAGLIGAVGDNGKNGTGLNWHVKIMPIRAILSTGEGDYSTVIQAIDYAVNNGADIISLSFVGNENDSALRDRLRTAYDKGILVVAAAGNHTHDIVGDFDSRPVFPACYDSGDTVNWMLTVGSVNSFGQLSSFSNFGSCVDIVAPGENIFSTERYAPQYGYSREFGGPWKGTSFAAPLVAGAAALVKSLQPEWRAKELIEVLDNAADPIDSVNLAYQGKLGHGRLNVAKAVDIALKLKPSGPVGGFYYYFSSSTISRLNFTTRKTETVQSLGGDTIQSVALYNPNVGLKAQIAALVARRSFYYVRLLKDTGEPLSEFSLEIPINRQTVVKKLKTTPLASSPGRFVVEVYYPQKNKTIFKVFNDRGEIVKEIPFFGSVEAWTLGRFEPVIFVGAKTSRNLVFSRLPLDGSVGSSYSIPQAGAVKIDALRSGHLNQGEGEEIVFLAHRSNKIENMIVNFEKKTATTTLVSETRDKAPWRLLLADSTASEEALLFPFAVNGGIFRLVTTDGSPVAEIKLPVLIGTTE